jgi:ribosome maturation factor RimP
MNNFDTIKQFVQDILEGSDSFVVSEHHLPGNEFKFLIDADTSFDIKRCVSATRQLRKKIEDAALFPEGDFTMEISSPGPGIARAQSLFHAIPKVSQPHDR